jgi:hypothetical protein
LLLLLPPPSLLFPLLLLLSGKIDFGLGRLDTPNVVNFRGLFSSSALIDPFFAFGMAASARADMAPLGATDGPKRSVLLPEADIFFFWGSIFDFFLDKRQQNCGKFTWFTFQTRDLLLLSNRQQWGSGRYFSWHTRGSRTHVNCVTRYDRMIITMFRVHMSHLRTERDCINFYTVEKFDEAADSTASWRSVQ